MKKHIIILAAFFAAALLISGCYPNEELKSKAQGLTISLYSDEPETKSGDGTSFENVIDHFEFFFFKDAAGTQPIPGMHGSVDGDETTLDTSENGDFSALHKGTSYVYILANFPETFDHSHDWTMAQLLALEINAPIVKEKKTGLDPDTNQEEETGEVVFCDYLVMDSYQKASDGTAATYTTKLTPQQVDDEADVTIGLSRLSTKLVLIIDVASSVDGNMPNEKWTPVLKDTRAYYVNALNNKTTVSANAIQRSGIPAREAASYQYLTYPTKYPLTPDPKGANPGYHFTTASVFTYPQTWNANENGEPYFKVQMTWSSNYRGTAPVYYKIRVPKAASDGTCTLNRNTCYTVTANLAIIDTENEYVEVTPSYKVTPWAASGWIGGDNLAVARFFNVPKTVYEIFSQEELSIPFYSSSAVSAYLEQVEYRHYGDKSRPLYHFTLGEPTTTITLPTTDSNGKTVASAAQDKNEYKVEIDGKFAKFTHKLTNIYTERIIQIKIKNLDGAEEIVTIHQHPALEVKAWPSTTAFVNGHFARASANVHVNGTTTKMGVGYTVNYLPDSGQKRYHSDDRNISGYWYHPGGTTYNESQCPRVQKNTSKGIYGAVEGDWSFSMNGDFPNLISVAVTAFNETNNSYTIVENGTVSAPKTYRVGDPRVSAGTLFDDLKSYLYQSSTVRNDNGTTTVGAAVYKAWDTPSEILISSTNKNDGNVIAPKLLVSSFFNAMPSGSPCTYAETRKRAATYQEAGYPAGRWRLPTEAEIMFLYARQIDGTIPTLWGNGTKYWCADGRYVQIQNGVPTFFDNDGQGHYNRFVYDLWYWGDDPQEDTETYWPNMHLVKPNQQ